MSWVFLSFIYDISENAQEHFKFPMSKKVGTAISQPQTGRNRRGKEVNGGMCITDCRALPETAGNCVLYTFHVLLFLY